MFNNMDIEPSRNNLTGGEASIREFCRLYETVFPILFRVAYRIAGSEEAAEDL